MVNAVCPHNFGYKKICVVVRARSYLKKKIEINTIFPILAVYIKTDSNVKEYRVNLVNAE
jgi:hypothetical protein